MSHLSSRSVARRIDAELKRQERTRSWLARQLGVNAMWVSRRLSGTQRLKIDEVADISATLAVPPKVLLDRDP